MPPQARPIDMGLPSGIQWASCNVGAEKPADIGLYFSWGNIVGHREGEEYNFTQSVYNSTPAAGIDTDLSLDQDAARANMGEPWRMPTDTEFQELVDNCTSQWTTVNGVSGVLFTSNLNGETLFFPAAGRYDGKSLLYAGTYGYYWSTVYNSETRALLMNFSSQSVSPHSGSNRYFGVSVRAVMPSL